MRPVPQPVGPGQESVWRYPRPAIAQPTDAHIVIEQGGLILANSRSAVRTLETSHPPSYYIPPGDITPGVLRRAEGSSFCEWKGEAIYYDLHGGDRIARGAAWGYPAPLAGFGAITGCVAVYAARVDACWVGEERVTPQPGGFYGGWVTSAVVGPFKGGPGTAGW